MAVLAGSGVRLELRDVSVRPVRGVAERRRWDALMSEFHYLPFKGLFGQSLRHVAECGGSWLALVGWTAGAFKVGVRDAWIGWPPERRFRRLKLIANNSRFALLCGRGEVRNLASRVLGLSLRRLSGDMREAHGFAVLLAETFVDPSRFGGTCYRASNWRMLGLTRGYSRVYGSPARWRANGRPKEVYVYELEAGAREALREGAAPAEAREAPMPAVQLRTLYEFLGRMEDFRKRRGQRYALACYVTIAIAARLAGYRGVSAFGELAARLDEAQRRAVGGFFSPTRRCYTVPAASSFHYILSELPPDTLEEALRAWSARHAGLAPVAMDGKDVRGASRRSGDGRQMMVAAVEHGSGLVLGQVLGQVRIDAKSNEIPAARELARRLDLAGRVVTLDAIHAQQDTARCLVEDCKAHYAITAVKGNQPDIHADLADIDWSRARFSAETFQKAHGRMETRRCAAVDPAPAKWGGRCALHGRRQALRVERGRVVIKTGEATREVACGLTSLGAGEAEPDELLDIVRRHWEVENRVHYVRDFSHGEDRCRAAAGHLPQNLAALGNAAISIVRVMGRFDYLPQANRHHAARPRDALDAIPSPAQP